MAASLEFSAGRLYWRNIRSVVEECKFKGYDVAMFEGAGFLSRKFVLKGDDEAIQAIHDWLQGNAR